ncbi:PREDICTED: cleavage stimulation factor subunit 3-like [Ficedula albicollis]|uniref:cleavage stimulation factor subunit 3-like n=1 Tax=Ficedula albicollis TaxID=59894 RepID=UPI000359942F|nr:PREDICTED: cleavage stimulation factor subunit 3-like [Ficedula albicollis]
MIEDRSRDYMNARRVAKEYETVMKGLDRNAPSVPPQNTPQEAQQVDMWKKYIQWEKSNPLRTEDQTLITKRGSYVRSCHAKAQRIVFLSSSLSRGLVFRDCAGVEVDRVS